MSDETVVTVFVCWCGKPVVTTSGELTYVDAEGEISAVCGDHK